MRTREEKWRPKEAIIHQKKKKKKKKKHTGCVVRHENTRRWRAGCYNGL